MEVSVPIEKLTVLTATVLWDLKIAPQANNVSKGAAQLMVPALKHARQAPAVFQAMFSTSITTIPTCTVLTAWGYSVWMPQTWPPRPLNVLRVFRPTDYVSHLQMRHWTPCAYRVLSRTATVSTEFVPLSRCKSGSSQCCPVWDSCYSCF